MSNVVEYVCLAIDAVIFTTIYKLYKDSSKSLESIKTAAPFEISKQLESDVRSYPKNVVPYAVVHGAVRAIGHPIVSSKAPNFEGVIQETIIREHKMQWSWATRWWRDVQKDVSHTTNTVPFGLVSPTDKTMVEVMEPLQAEGLKMMSVYDEFKPSHLGFWDSITRFFIGETTTGHQYIEKVLPEGTMLTGIGALVLKPGGVRLEPPAQKLKYYLTHMSETSLMKTLDSEVKTLRTLAIVFGTFGGIVVTIILFKYYHKYRERKMRESELKRMRELIEERVRNREQSNDEGGEGDGELSSEQTCLICCTNRREVLILECGHLCCCVDCGNALDPALCPVCRGPISRLVMAFLP